MVATATGTVYTVRTADLAEHGRVYYAVADAKAGATDIPFILYAHGAGGAGNQFATLSAWRGLRDWLIDNGWAWVEGDGGKAHGSQNWGNVESRAAYQACVAYAETQLDLGVGILLGRSMGGLPTAWLYAHDTRYSGWINNSGVSTWFTGDADSTLNYFTESVITDAWDTDNLTDLTNAILVADGAPELWAPSVWAGKRILCCYGTADTTVPFYPRGASQLRTIWAGLPTVDIIAPKAGGDHSSGNGSYQQVPEMVAFLETFMTDPPVPVEPPSFLRVLSVRLVSGGQLYSITFPES